MMLEKKELKDHDLQDLINETQDLINETIDHLNLLREKDQVDSIANLKDPRRKLEAMFLEGILKEIQEEIQDKNDSKQNYPNIINAAHLVCNEHLSQTKKILEKEDNSFFHKLNIAIIKRSNLEKHVFNKARALSNLNKFLLCIFDKENPLNGFKKDHCLSKLDKEGLKDLLKISYQLEEKTLKAYYKDLPTEGATKVDISDYLKNRKKTALSLSNTISWQTLEKEFDGLIYDQKLNKRKAEFKSTKMFDRDSQILILMKCKDILKQLALQEEKDKRLEETEQSAIFMGFMYLVRGQISFKEYNFDPLNSDPIERSLIHTGLTNIVKAKTANYVDIESQLQAAKRFLASLCIEASAFYKQINLDITHDSIRKEHLFSNIPNFPIKDALIFIESLIRTCREKQLEQCFFNLEQERKETVSKEPSAASKSFFSKYFSRTQVMEDYPPVLFDNNDTKEGKKEVGNTSLNV